MQRNAKWRETILRFTGVCLAAISGDACLQPLMYDMYVAELGEVQPLSRRLSAEK